MQSQILGIDDRNNWNDLQSNFCSVLMSVIRKLGDGILPLADQIMALALQLIQAAGKTATVLEDAFMMVGTLAGGESSLILPIPLPKTLSKFSCVVMEQRFDPYMQSFLPLLHPALKAHEDSQLCTVAVGVLGDLSRALGDKTGQYANAFMSVLLENLQSDVLNRNVKVPILACFADIAMAIGTGFEPYLDTAITVLRQAGAIMPNPVRYTTRFLLVILTRLVA